MAYADLYADAAVYMSFNNTATPVTLGQIRLPSSGTPIFTADAPPNTDSTHSINISRYATSRYVPPSFNGLPFQATDNLVGRTLSLWFKVAEVGVPNTYGSNHTLLTNDHYGQADNSIIFTGGIRSWARESAVGKIQTTVQEVSTTTSNLVQNNNPGTSQPAYSVIPGIWNHIAVVEKSITSTLIARAIYLNGSSVYYATFGSRAFAYASAWGQGTGNFSDILNLFTTTTTTDPALKKIAHYAVWNRALTKAEIRALAEPGLATTESYEDVIKASNPVYFTTLNNPTKDVNAEVFGTQALTWGPINDDAPAITTNADGVDGTKAWRHDFQSVAANNNALTTTPGLRKGFSDIQKTGNYTVEFWFKHSATPKNTDTVPFLSFGDGVFSTLQNGFLRFNISNNGRHSVQIANRTGPTTYTSQSVSYSIYNGGVAFDIGPGSATTPSFNDFTDDQWHHVVIRQSNAELTGNGFIVHVFYDGFNIGNSTLVSTSGWLGGTGDITSLMIGHNTTTAIPHHFIDNIAVYNRALTYDEIQEHFRAGIFEPEAPVGGSIKYYDGTDWQDATEVRVYTEAGGWALWQAERYDGTNWVAI